MKSDMLGLTTLGGHLQGFEEEQGTMRSNINAVRGEKHSILASTVEAERKVSPSRYSPELLPLLLSPESRC